MTHSNLIHFSDMGALTEGSPHLDEGQDSSKK